MGAAGTGKSMQGRMFADERGYAWISTGELLRVLVTGKRRQDMLAGKLLSDDEMIRILDKVFELINLSEEFVIDGFPRTLTQTDWLLEQVQNGRFNLTAVFNLMAPPEVIRRRLKARGRLDDTEEAITRRLAEYDKVVLPIIAAFKRQAVPVFDIDAVKTPQEVHDDIFRCIQTL